MLAALLLVVLPVRDIGLMLVLAATADLAIAAILVRMIVARRRKEAGSAVVNLDNSIPVALRRRTEPTLRARHPTGVVEMQVRWRQVVEAHRRTHRNT